VDEVTEDVRCATGAAGIVASSLDSGIGETMSTFWVVRAIGGFSGEEAAANDLLGLFGVVGIGTIGIGCVEDCTGGVCSLPAATEL